MYQQAAHLHPAIVKYNRGQIPTIIGCEIVRIHELSARRLHGTQGAVDRKLKRYNSEMWSLWSDLQKLSNTLMHLKWHHRPQIGPSK